MSQEVHRPVTNCRQWEEQEDPEAASSWKLGGASWRSSLEPLPQTALAQLLQSSSDPSSSWREEDRQQQHSSLLLCPTSRAGSTELTPPSPSPSPWPSSTPLLPKNLQTCHRSRLKSTNLLQLIANQRTGQVKMLIVVKADSFNRWGFGAGHKILRSKRLARIYIVFSNQAIEDTRAAQLSMLWIC